MSQSEEREEGLPPSKTTLSGEHDSQTKAKSPVQQERPDSPVPSCVSMKSDWSMDQPRNFKDKHLSENMIQQERPDSPEPSCVSMKSDWSMDQPIAFKDGHQSEGTLAPVCQRKVKSNLKEKFQCLFEGIAKAGNPTLLNQIYTELHITEGESGEVNDEHEVRQIETASRKPVRPETTIKCEDIFKPLPGRDKAIRTVMTKGVAGIGKTVLTQKFTLDWAEDKANHNIQFTFPFTFRELNLLKGKKYSLVELLHHFFIETKAAGICRFDKFQVVFIFDGLDECRLPLDFQNNEIWTDVTESTSVDVLLTNLIKGKLLPSC
ncbi:NACHT, LRR and PYD domains-containing protein 3-like [Centroberyx gerrardi]